MKTVAELEKQFGITPERIAEIDENAALGKLEGDIISVTTGPGRPPLSNEVLQQITFKEPKGVVAAIDARAAQLGLRRSDYLRQLVDNDLLCAGI